MKSIVRMINKVLEKIFRNVVFRMRTGLAKGMVRRFGFGFKPRFSLTLEEEFLLGFDFKDKIIYDIGGYIGIYALFFARAAGSKGKVITFEPNPENFNELSRNLALNHIQNMTSLQLGVGASCQETWFIFDPVYPSRGHFSTHLKDEGEQNARRVMLQIDTLDDIFEKHALPAPDFIKIDVEGFEMETLRGAEKLLQRFAPELLVEIHQQQPQIKPWLLEQGYHIHHVEAGVDITTTNHPIRHADHLFCSKPVGRG
jgi:FkbM family methyltransferase